MKDRNYLIRIDSVIEDARRDEKPETIQLMTRGNFLRKDGNFFIVYDETEATGLAGCTTTIKVSEDAKCVSMLRSGPLPSHLVIEKGTRHMCHYETELGDLTLGIAADSICHTLDDRGGKVKFSYTLDSGDTELLTCNRIDVTVTPITKQEAPLSRPKRKNRPSNN